VRILDVQADPELLRQRVAARAWRRDDPSEAGLEVLEAQLRSREPFGDAEAALAVPFPAGAAAGWPEQIRTLKNVLFPAPAGAP
jgi:predicted kinase